MEISTTTPNPATIASSGSSSRQDEPQGPVPAPCPQGGIPRPAPQPPHVAGESPATSGTFSATYDPADNKLRLRSLYRLNKEPYARVRAAGFIFAPKQDLFVAPGWTPEREDLLLEMCGDIGDEDTSLVDRAAARAERFEGYSERREDEADAARRAVAAIADNIPVGQPILVGHHSEKRARRDADRIETGMRKAVRLWETSQYWTDRAAGALRHAKYKERADVRARRIKKLEAERRGFERNKKQAEMFLRHWEAVHHDGKATIRKKDGAPSTMLERVRYLLRGDWTTGLDTKLDKGEITPEEVQGLRVAAHQRAIARFTRWITHTDNRLAYERALLADAGGIVADKGDGPEVGGAIRCWASPGFGRGWSFIVKVNRVTVTIADQAEHGGRIYRQTIALDKVKAVMSRAEVEGARADGRLVDAAGGTGFFLTDERPAAPRGEDKNGPSEAEMATAAMKESLRAGVAVVSAPQLFPTPPELAARMVREANIQPGHRVLEPSAGTGNLLRAIADLERDTYRPGETAHVVAVEISAQLAHILPKWFAAEVITADFLSLSPEGRTPGLFDRIIMNPPFAKGADVDHIRHAWRFLKPGGRLVALCADGPRQRETLKPWAEEMGGAYESLGSDVFKDQGTSVLVALIVIEVRS